jgi:anti-anti-sigma factor
MSLILGIDRRRDADCVTVIVSGELDLSTSGRLRAELDASTIEPGVKTIVLDLRELLFCDSAGIATLLTSSVLARAEGVELVLVQPDDPAAATFFEVTGLAQALHVRSAGESGAGRNGDRASRQTAGL